MRQARRPALLLGGGLRRQAASAALTGFEALSWPLLTTWNGADRVPAAHPLYFGRPNTWGQRDSNVILQQADLVVVLGSRLGLQQTGFNWQEFAPVADVVQVDIDESELSKGHPAVKLPIRADASEVLGFVLDEGSKPPEEWLSFCRGVKASLAGIDTNATREGYLDPYRFVRDLSSAAAPGDVIVPCSSGGAFTVMMQAFDQKPGQRIVTNKGLAAMGYGLSGALGAALARPDRRVILVEGDGGFAQNMQELGTVAVCRPNLKIFIFDDHGYASIRMTQRNYFGGDYMGCDTETGLGLPDWAKLFAAYGLPHRQLAAGWNDDRGFQNDFSSPGPMMFTVPIDPEQTYFPKIMSRVTDTGTMVSNPLHAMSPPLPEKVAERVYRYVPDPYR